ncbi:MAG: hypothetical protein ACRD8Z_22270 [Nitrososphaeraceae archaeon]
MIIPILPNVDIKRKLTDEQLLHTLDIIPSDDPENNDFLLIFSFECLIAYTFILTKMPIRIEIIVVKTKPTVASSGK